MLQHSGAKARMGPSNKDMVSGHQASERVWSTGRRVQTRGPDPLLHLGRYAHGPCFVSTDITPARTHPSQEFVQIESLCPYRKSVRRTLIYPEDKVRRKVSINHSPSKCMLPCLTNVLKAWWGWPEAIPRLAPHIGPDDRGARWSGRITLARATNQAVCTWQISSQLPISPHLSVDAADNHIPYKSRRPSPTIPSSRPCRSSRSR